MKMTGEQAIAAPRQKVWEALNDPEVLRRCIPGCQTLEKEGEDRLKATAEIKIGPIGARFAGVVALSELDPPNGYTISGEGQGGTAGFAKGGAKVRLSDGAGGGTLLAYDVDAQVGGRLAQLGGPIIDATAKQMAAGFFKQLGQIVSGDAPAAKAVTGPAAAASSAAVAREAPAAAPVRTPAPRAAGAGGFPIAWVLALVVAGLAGYLLGHAGATGGGEVGGLTLGLLVVVVAAAAFEYGRRVAAPVLQLDAAALQRLAQGGPTP